MPKLQREAEKGIDELFWKENEEEMNNQEISCDVISSSVLSTVCSGSSVSLHQLFFPMSSVQQAY